MGSCWCKGNIFDGVLGRRASNTGSGMSEETPSVAAYNARNSLIAQYIIQMVELVGNISQSFDEQPAPLVKLHMIADKDDGWQSVMELLVKTVPLCRPLGPSAITIIFDDCPLPAVSTVLHVLKTFDLGSRRALSSHLSPENKRNERNMLVVLGCMAEKFAGLISGKLLTPDVVEYLIAFLNDRRIPELVLQSLITIEKFAKTKANKLIFLASLSKLEEQNPLIHLERYFSEDFVWRQVRFCARWLLDNMFFVPGRPLSYTVVDMSDINAILDCADVTDFLKISSDGLGARCDAHTFESVRCTFKVVAGSWYYEVEILTPGVMQIGWATKDTTFSAHEGYGIGDDHFSLAYDGCRRLLWHKATPRPCDSVKAWVPGDILGCLIDISRQEAIFSLNGVRLPAFKDLFKHSRASFYAAASFMCFQGAQFNFGVSDFRFAPTDREYMTFNDHGILSEEAKQVVPRWLHLERVQASQDDDLDEDAICAICYDRKPDIILSPCRHKGFCGECAFRLTDCPMCRERVWHYSVLPL